MTLDPIKEEEFHSRRGRRYEDPKYDGRRLYKVGDKLWVTEAKTGLVYEVLVILALPGRVHPDTNPRTEIPYYKVRFIGHDPKTELRDITIIEWDLYSPLDMPPGDILYCGDHNRLSLKKMKASDRRKIVEKGLVFLSDDYRKELLVQDKKLQKAAPPPNPSVKANEKSDKKEPKPSPSKKAPARPSNDRDRKSASNNSEDKVKRNDKRQEEGTADNGRGVPGNDLSDGSPDKRKGEDNKFKEHAGKLEKERAESVKPKKHYANKPKNNSKISGKLLHRKNITPAIKVFRRKPGPTKKLLSERRSARQAKGSTLKLKRSHVRPGLKRLSVGKAKSNADRKIRQSDVKKNIKNIAAVVRKRAASLKGKSNGPSKRKRVSTKSH